MIAVDAGQENGVDHGIVDVFAFQEALLIEAALAVVLLTMIWVGFRRWLQHKERMSRYIAEQAAERSAHYAAQMEGVEARLKAIEQIVSVQPSEQIEPSATMAAGSTSKRVGLRDDL